MAPMPTTATSTSPSMTSASTRPIHPRMRPTRPRSSLRALVAGYRSRNEAAANPALSDDLGRVGRILGWIGLAIALLVIALIVLAIVVGVVAGSGLAGSI